MQDQGASSDSVNRFVEQSCREGGDRRQDDEVETLDHEDGLLTPSLSCFSNEQSLRSQVGSVATHTSVFTPWRTQIKQTHIALST